MLPTSRVSKKKQRRALVEKLLLLKDQSQLTDLERELIRDIYTPVSRDIDISLRIALLAKQLKYRTDLTLKERRALQSRKNTSMFRERRRQLEVQQ